MPVSRFVIAWKVNHRTTKDRIGANIMETEAETHDTKRRVLAGSIGDCVHSLGVETFAEWMEDRGVQP